MPVDALLTPSLFAARVASPLRRIVRLLASLRLTRPRALGWLLTLLAIGPTAFAASPASSHGSTDLQPARHAFASLDINATEAALNRYTQSATETDETLYLRTRIANLRNQPDVGLDIAERCVAAFPDASKCYEALGEANAASLLISGGLMSQLGQARAAKSAWERAVALDPDNYRAAILLLRYYGQAPWVAGGSKGKAKKLAKVLAARSTPHGLQAKGLIALVEERPQDAVAPILAAATQLNQNLDARFYVAIAYGANEQAREAIATLESIVQDYPKFTDGWFMLGSAVADANSNPVRAIQALEHYLNHAPNLPARRHARALALIGTQRAQQGDAAAARTAYNKALTLNEDEEQAAAGLAALGAE